MMQYRREFEIVMNVKQNLDLEVLMSIFLNGLKGEIQAELKVGEF